jgi:hypothetical protein
MGSNTPLAAPTLNQSHYGLLLSGCDTDEKEAWSCRIPPVFHLSFSKEKNLRSWAACSAVLFTQAPLNHHLV